MAHPSRFLAQWFFCPSKLLHSSPFRRSQQCHTINDTYISSQFTWLQNLKGKFVSSSTKTIQNPDTSPHYPLKNIFITSLKVFLPLTGCHWGELTRRTENESSQVVSKSTSWACSKLSSGLKIDFGEQSSGVWILLRLTDKTPSASVLFVCVCVCVCVFYLLASGTFSSLPPCSPGNSTKVTQCFDTGSLWAVIGKRRLHLHDLISLHYPDSLPERISVT